MNLKIIRSVAGFTCADLRDTTMSKEIKEVKRGESCLYIHGGISENHTTCSDYYAGRSQNIQ